MASTASPMALSLSRLKCIEQEDSEVIIDVEDDEPYVIVLTIDGQSVRTERNTPIPMVSASISRIGPVENFDEGDLKPAPANIIWELMDLRRRSPMLIGWRFS